MRYEKNNKMGTPNGGGEDGAPDWSSAQHRKAFRQWAKETAKLEDIAPIGQKKNLSRQGRTRQGGKVKVKSAI